MSLFDADVLKNAPVRQVLNPGKYHVRVEKAAEVVSKNKGTPGIEFGFAVIVGPMQENQADPAGRKCFGTIWSSQNPETRGMFYGQIHALANAIGFDLSTYAGMSSEEFTPLFLSNLLQKELVLTVKNEEYQGNLKETIGGFSAL